MGTSASLIQCNSAGEATQPEDDATEFHRQEEFILSTVYPDLTSYTWEDPRPRELLQLQNLSIDVNTYPYMLAFDRAFFSILGQFERPVPFFARGYSFQKAFLVKLLVVVLHPVSEYSGVYEAFVELFITQYLAEGVAISEYGQIGEAFVIAMASLETLNGESEQMWGRAYSRFIRAIM